jgi:zinc transporter ZupT
VSTFLVAVFAAAGFSGAALLALPGRGASPAVQSYATAAAAGILLALAFGDLFPESLAMAQREGRWWASSAALLACS